MNKMLKDGGFLGAEMSPYPSRFERPESGLCGDSAVRVQFGHKLRAVFELPTVQSQPDGFQCLLKQIEAKLGNKV
jgi:hypothetical protein